jgi:hypothetical protein
MKSFKSIHLLVFAFSITEIPLFANSPISVEEAVKKGFIKLSIKAKGGYTGDVMKMEIQNLTNKTLDIKLEAGRILDSQNNNQQDILVTKPQEVFLSSKESKNINVFGMCCQAHNGAPTADADYKVGKLADSSLIKLANFIDKNKYYTNTTAQEAVWCVSDNNSLGSIVDGDINDVNILRKFVSHITGRPIPSYNITYKRQNDRDVLGSVTKIDGVFDYLLPANCHATLGIYNNQGQLIQTIFQNIAHQKGEYNIYYTFRTKDLPKGIYYARMNADGHLHKEMQIEF